MAKGLRASVNKRNKSKLRDRVFGPVEAARTERLSAKLLELAQQAKPTRDTEMKVDGQEVETPEEKEQANTAEDVPEDMEVDEGVTKLMSSKSSSKKKKGRVEKRRHRKEKNNITFKSKKPRRRGDKIGRA